MDQQPFEYILSLAGLCSGVDSILALLAWMPTHIDQTIIFSVFAAEV
jgi:hypothetical protein